MNKFFENFMQKTHLDGGIAHAFWMLRYNMKLKLIRTLITWINAINGSITKQSQKRALRDLAIIAEQEKQGVYTYRTTKEFLKKQADE
jgi:hypothetical protein